MDDNIIIPEFFDEYEFDDLFGILETLDNTTQDHILQVTLPLDEAVVIHGPTTNNTSPPSAALVSQKSISSSSSSFQLGLEPEFVDVPLARTKKPKFSPGRKSASPTASEDILQDGQPKISHITVERNRRKQMNEHLSVLRSLMPCFYVKRGDQASIIGGVVDYIKEMQQVLQSLEAKRQRKVYSEVLSPRVVVSSPRPNSLPLSPRKPPISPRVSLPASPRTPTQTSPYKPRMQKQLTHLSSSPTSHEPTSSISSSTLDNNILYVKEQLIPNPKSSPAKVEVKFAGPNVLLKTISARIPGQATKIISTLEGLSLEILHVNINLVDSSTMLNSFTIKIGIECKLSVEELAHEVQQTFC
ncbi:hypothetical protein C5167_027387 [Papaver somniferum]|uniref:transcription factor SPEECHLESS-like n=1 Tax=Papaver somniferum TaxID=3469 RepID=UPI000E700D97|nr:transcription factor SPEECHLESS-like [Papaver somniferum]RZC91324.1 hypothetical protein C5167_027387 [Papaver somniferum]